MKARGEEDQVRFDTAIPTLAQLLVDRLDLQLDTAGYFLRDGFGRVAYFCTDRIPPKVLKDINAEAARRLDGYAFPPGALQLTETKDVRGHSVLWRSLQVAGREWQVRVVDRRLIGRDWLTPPVPQSLDLPPILTFGSLKGGVGRTTALFVLATYLARIGRNVLLVDLDLEAPGLSSLVFEPGQGPSYGALEYLVESRLRRIDDQELSDFVATSSLTDRMGYQGRVDLLPATGSKTEEVPQTMLAKLARAMVESPSPQGPILLSQQIAEMVSRFAKAQSYDAILVDARAGLAELSAAPLVGLGGDVILFGTDHRHTFEGYRYLTAHLGLLAAAHEGPEWRDKIHFVHARASVRNDRLQDFDDQLFETLADTFYDRDEGGDTFTFSLDEDFAPHRAWVIYHDASFLDGEFLVQPETFESPILTAVFGDFLQNAIQVLEQADARRTP